MLTNFSKYRRIRYPTKRQIEVWFLKRNMLSGRKIAKQRRVTPAFISKTLKEANRRIKSILENTAKANKVTLSLINPEQGFAKGNSHIFNMITYITFSPENGVQVWYDHTGDCATCEEYAHCRKILLQEFKERKIILEDPQQLPTDMGKYLFQTLEERTK